MSWDAVGAVGEIVGALAVVVSLIYLAGQVRLGARATRADTELESARMWSEFHARVAHSPDMTRIWDGGHTDPESLSEQDRQRFVWLVAEYMYLVEALFKQRERGFLSPDSWEPHEGTIAGLLENEIARRWWESGVSPYSKDFLRYVDALIGSRVEKKWDYVPLAELGDETRPQS